MVSEEKTDWRERLTPKAVVTVDDLRIISTKKLPGETLHGLYFSIEASDSNPYIWMTAICQPMMSARRSCACII